MKTKYILTIITMILVTAHVNAINYIWLGNSGNWSDSSSWSPTGTPGVGDNITINSNATNNLVLDQNRTVTNFTINGDTIDLGGYEFTITGTATFNGGKITNGTLLPIGTLCHFGGGIFDIAISATSGYYHMNGGTFMLPVNLTSSTASTSGTGGCVFNDSLTINNTGSYYFTMGSSGKDYFHGPLSINNTSTHEVYLSTGDSGFYNHNIILNSTNGGGVTFGNTGGVSTLATGKTITIGTTGFTNDYLTLKNFKQLGTTSQILT